MGKAYANRKTIDKRPEADFYETPYILTQELINLDIFDKSKLIYDPAAGNNAIISVLNKNGFKTKADDIRTTGKDFLDCTETFPQAVVNPPFSLLDGFLAKLNECCTERYAVIIRTNAFAAFKRYRAGIWKNLRHVYIFSRQISYEYAPEINKCGCLVSSWCYFDKTWNKDYWNSSILDIQKYFEK
jgi:hypothetical protein